MDPIPARQRIEMLFDSFEELALADGLTDPIGFPGYQQTLDSAPGEAIVWGIGRVGTHRVVAALFEFSFLGGSMGDVVGATLEAAMSRALTDGLSFLAVTASGGARMQEGMFALAQMPRAVSASVALAAAGIPRITILGHPTTGGVYASFASLSDILLADQGATIGFAGPRVAEAVAGAPLPEHSHTAEAAYEHGLIDAVVPPQMMRDRLTLLLNILAPAIPQDVPQMDTTSVNVGDAWEEYLLARHAERPTNSVHTSNLFDQVFEFHGDRMGNDDPGVITALVRFAERPVVLIALNRTHPNASG
ncbi:MAG: acetyl-CoA carboxylase carboxyltransferase subunit alpha/beta, partial [Actinomycetota bacterium]